MIGNQWPFKSYGTWGWVQERVNNMWRTQPKINKGLPLNPELLSHICQGGHGRWPGSGRVSHGADNLKHKVTCYETHNSGGTDPCNPTMLLHPSWLTPCYLLPPWRGMKWSDKQTSGSLPPAGGPSQAITVANVSWADRSSQTASNPDTSKVTSGSLQAWKKQFSALSNHNMCSGQFSWLQTEMLLKDNPAS